MSHIRVYWWSESGELLGTSLVEALPPVGACIYMNAEFGGPRVVVRHWTNKPSEDAREWRDWHVVLRPWQTLSEQVPPWEREEAAK